MEIKINMMNVGDGEAIVVRLKKSVSEQLLVLIDGGHVKDAPATIKVLEAEAKEAGKNGPDLIICTHYDADHIGGLKKITQHFAESIGQVWLHQPGIVKRAMHLASAMTGKANLHMKFEEFEQKDLLNEALEKEGLKEEGGLVLESYGDMAELVMFLNDNKIKNKEPFSGDSLKDWPEIKVLGPTKAFYKKCYDDISKPYQLLLEEAKALREEKLLLENKKNNKLSLVALADPCSLMDKHPVGKVTKINQVSVILEITASNKKYLFTGDASIESFEEVPGYPDALKNIYWLKVAHHGSRNNSSPDLFDIMSPKYADISGGKRYLDNEVRDCLEKKGAKVRTTRDKKTNLVFPY